MWTLAKVSVQVSHLLKAAKRSEFHVTGLMNTNAGRARFLCNDQQVPTTQLFFSAILTIVDLDCLHTHLITMIKLPTGISTGKWKHGLSHFLRVPFATSISTTQLHQSIQQIARDPIAAALPQIAWNNPGRVHCVIAVLSLKTTDRVNAAVQLLQDLDLTQISDHVAIPSPKNHFMHSAAQDTTIRDEGTVTSKQAPVVALQGLQDPQLTARHPHATRGLRCYVKESRPFLARFRSLLAVEFDKAGFLPFAPLQQQSSPVTCTLMETKYLRTKAWRRKVELGGKEYRLQPDFDALDLHLKYEKFPWTTDFPLEKLCISEFGLKDFLKEGKVVETGYRDIASVPLPGAPASLSVGRHIDGYSKAAITKKKNSPVTPLLIPSTPPTPRS